MSREHTSRTIAPCTLALAVALIGANFLRGGNWLIGGAMIGGAAFLNGWRILIPAREESAQKRKPRNFELDRARSLLGIDERADRSAINDAWRERLAEHHPDRGGDEELARQINRARDILLDALDSQQP